jgi:hypothetical protein
MDGRRSPQSLATSRLTSQPETIPSCSRRTRHAQFQPLPGRHPKSHLSLPTYEQGSHRTRQRGAASGFSVKCIPRDSRCLGRAGKPRYARPSDEGRRLRPIRSRNSYLQGVPSRVSKARLTAKRFGSRCIRLNKE